jgi:type IX secretion system PorP/SprF family membrane protein
MKNIFFLIAFLIGGCAVHAQQDHQYTQFMYNKLMINPGYAGARGVPSISGIYRSQWVGFEGAPTSQVISFSGPFLSKRVGIGVNISNRKLGLSRDLIGQLAYSYDLLAQDNNLIRIGLSGGVRNFAIDLTKANPVVDVTIDPSLQNRKISNLNFNVGAGVYASFNDALYIGLSVPTFLTNTYGINNTNPVIAREVRHVYGMIGAAWPLSQDVVLMPALLTKYVKNAPFDADLNLSLGIKERVTTGVSYRLGGDGTGESVDLLLMVNVTPQLGIGAAYDFTLSQIKDHSAGSFEVSAFYDIKKRETTSKGKVNMSNPRFFF